MHLLKPLATTCSLLLAFSPHLTRAETLAHNGHLITMDAGQPIAEAMVFDDAGKILAVGKSAELRAQFPDAKSLDLKQRSVVPGLIDAHGHVLNQGLALMRVDLVGTRSKAEILDRLKAFARGLPDDAWLLGRGWDQNDWGGNGEFPTAEDLDKAFPERPVWLTRIDGHAGWANSAALKHAARSLDGDWQPAGGQIVRSAGKPSGVFVDAAMSVIADSVPAESEAVLREALKRSTEHLVHLGITAG